MEVSADQTATSSRMPRGRSRHSDESLRERSSSMPARTNPGSTHRERIEDRTKRLHVLGCGHRAIEKSARRLQNVSGAVYMIIMINECLNAYEFTPEGLDVPGFMRLYAAICAHLEDQATVNIPVDFLETVQRFRETNTLQDQMVFVDQLESLGINPDSFAHLKEVLLKRAVVASSQGLADNADLRPEVVLKKSLVSWVNTFIESEELWQRQAAEMRQREYVQECKDASNRTNSPVVEDPVVHDESKEAENAI